MPCALNVLRPEPKFRRDCFAEGLRSAGFEVVDRLSGKPRPDDVLMTWNRHGYFDSLASTFERVLVAENAYLHRPGWYSLAATHHAGVGRWHVGSAERWASFGIELAPWREGGSEVVILGQRSIGATGVASPTGWEEKMKAGLRARIRPHPGPGEPPLTLKRDLENARCVVTWASSAALHALIMGIPVFYGLRDWVGAPACRHVDDFAQGPMRDDAARLAMFQRLAWAMSSVDEIRSGEAINRLLQS